MIGNIDELKGSSTEDRGQPEKGVSVPVTSATMQQHAKDLVFAYASAKLDKTDKHVTFSIDEVFVVWFAKTLQNWKCLISTTLPDGMYYEVTYDGDKMKTYLDAYKKFENVSFG